ncbi:MAG TPA: VWA domain-containing protein, partial [Pyrinomonadaceae bacterium]|nr:VWA domain-containing protein [Pyrinomonadaceae bacterium]
MFRGYRNFLAFPFAFILAAGLVINAQDKPKTDPDDEKIVVNTDLIEVPVVVTDGAGKLVKGLKASDLRLFEDGVEQEIAEFRTSTEPFDVALLLDTSGSTRSELNLIRRAASRFIASLREGDRVGMIAFRTDTAERRS